MKFQLLRRNWLKLAVLACSALTINVASADTNFPQKSVRLILPFAAGGASDALGRQLSEHLRKMWDQPVIVENRPGASAMIAADVVAKSPPDGYTALLTVTALVQAPVLYGKASFDPIKDFAPVSQVGTMPLAFVVRADSPVKTLDDYIKMARAEPGAISYGSFGTGSAGHLYIELLQDAAKIKLIHAPYKGEQPEITDLIGGQINAAIISVPGAKPFVDSGKLRAIAVTGAERTKQLPETPSFPEAGYAGIGLESIGWYGLLLPAKTPVDIVEKFSRDLNTVLALPEMQEKMDTYGIRLVKSNPEAFAQLIKDDFERWGKVIRDKKLQAN
ncbi:tripartite tricarboxylate transporter substrate binding protein [Alcaligenaceae bacterium]|nr:tripartite tricarboxylate transporter substrate binding protein [Alcaligenaceae bacterium]